jgi:hypothetical protein
MTEQGIAEPTVPPSQSQHTYRFHEREKGMCHVDSWTTITTHDVQLRDKTTQEPMALCSLDPYLFRNFRMETTTTTCECSIDKDRPLFGLLVEAVKLPDMFDEGTTPSYAIAPEQIEYLGISEKQLEKLEPLVLIIREAGGEHIAFKDFPVMLWEGKAINIKRNTILVNSRSQLIIDDIGITGDGIQSQDHAGNRGKILL